MNFISTIECLHNDWARTYPYVAIVDQIIEMLLLTE